MQSQSFSQPGARARFRRACRADGDALRAFLDRLSPATLQARYLSPAGVATRSWLDREFQRILDGNHSQHVVLLAMDGPHIRGVGEFVIDPPDRADIGVVVEDAFQGRGIGRSLFRGLAKFALHRRVREFTGDIAYGNVRALAMIRGTGLRLQMQVSSGTVHFNLALTDS